jgi:hypothetical protein
MKIILSLLLLVFAALLYIEPVFAQNDISQFAEENTIWSIGVFGYMNNFNTVYSTYYLKIQGDTVINGTDYYNIHKYNNTSDELTNESIVAFARIDENQKLYFRNTQGEEHQVFDYSMNQYNNFSFYAFCPYSFEFIEVSGSVIDKEEQVFEGVSRTVWSLTYTDIGYKNAPDVRWIEGIGTNYGLIFMGVTNITSTLHRPFCCWLNDNEIYHNPDYPLCEYDGLPSNFSLFAHPFTKWSIGIYDDNNNPDYTIWTGFYDYPFMNWENGDYYYNIVNNNNLILRTKISADNKLYFSTQSEPEDHKVFDYNLFINETDTLWSYNYNQNLFSEHIVTVSDTGHIETITGNKKYWTLSNGQGKTSTWIQGLGPKEGVLFANNNLTGTDSSTLVCAYYQTPDAAPELIYSNPLYNNCDFTSNPNREVLYFQNYPNPFTSELNIDLHTSLLPVYFKLYNSLGVMVLEKSIYTTSLKIKTQNLSKGLYVMKLNFMNGQIISSIIIKE